MRAFLVSVDNFLAFAPFYCGELWKIRNVNYLVLSGLQNYQIDSVENFVYKFVLKNCFFCF